MATQAAGSPPAITTVAGSARSCSKSFQNCLNKAAQIHHRELSLVEDQHARFAIWAANIRVFSAGRDSLDHRLREAADVQDAVIGLLQALDYRIQNCGTVPSVPQTATTLVAEKFRQAAAPSVISVSKTVALSSHDQLQFPPAPCGTLMKRYRRFKNEQEEQLKVILEATPGYYGLRKSPAPWARDAVRKHRASHKQTLDGYWDECLRAVGEVVCQFCFYALPSSGCGPRVEMEIARQE
ncbi:hypothetical protein NW754_004209 [Fusarium falciforme]|nr:hypothetical protein NW754_004209 [Fusarium falciforme]